jgi:hypothetical protein
VIFFAGTVETVKVGRGFTMTKPGTLFGGGEKNTEGINITKKLDIIKERLGKFLVN